MDATLQVNTFLLQRPRLLYRIWSALLRLWLAGWADWGRLGS